MANGELEKYISAAASSGKTKKEIRDGLLETGWMRSDVKSALKLHYKNLSFYEQRHVTKELKHRKTAFQEWTSTHLKRPGSYVILVAVFILVAGVVFYNVVILKEEISEFELVPQEADTAGITPGTGFILKSSVELSATVIKKNLEISPDVDFDVDKVSGESNTFEVKPKQLLAENEIYSIKIARGPIASKTYSWAYQVKAPFQVIATLPRNEGTGVPINTAIEITFNRENILNIEDYFEISPSVPGRFEMHRDTAVFVPLEELKPETVYSIRIKSGIKAKGSEDTLTEDREIKFETRSVYSSDLEPYFDFDRKFWEFKPDTEPIFEVDYRNIPEGAVQTSVYRFENPEEFVDSYINSVKDREEWTQYQDGDVIILPNERRIFESNLLLEEQVRVAFMRVPEKLGEGYYLVDVVVNSRHRQAWLQMTPITGFSAISGTKTFIWVKNLNSGDGIADAVVSFDNEVVGKTDSNGASIFDTPEQLIRSPDDGYTYYYKPLSSLYVVKTGDKKLVIPIEDEYGNSRKAAFPNAWWDYLSIDKSVYLPSDTVHFWGIVKQRVGPDLRGQKFTVQLSDRYWYGYSDETVVYSETEVVISDFNTITGSINFDDLSPGYYELIVREGNEVIVSETVVVETYIKPAYKLTLIPDKNAVFAGDTVTYEIKAEFFDGTPVSNLRVGYSGYGYSSSGDIEGEVQLDREGTGSLTAKPGYKEGEYFWPRYFEMYVSPVVAEEGSITGNAPVLVFGPRINIESRQSILEETSKFDLEVKNIVLDRVSAGEPYWRSESYTGSTVPGWNITANVAEIIYTRTEIGRGYDIINKTTYPRYRYSREERFVTQETLITGVDGKTHFEWNPEEGKHYRIDFIASDIFGRTARRRHYVYGSKFSYFGSSGTRQITLQELNDKDSYKLGEDINIQMQDSGGNALIPQVKDFAFIEISNGIISYRVSDSGNYTNSFQERYIPNLQIMGVWFNGSNFSDTYAINIPFDSDERRLDINVKRDKERYRPGDDVTLGINVTDKRGSPRRAEVNIAGIDEAIFSIRGQDVDVVNDLYRDIFSSLITRTSHFSRFEVGAEQGCFVTGTQVLTPAGLKSIEEIEIGDEILTRESESSQKIVTDRVRQISSHLVNSYLVINDNLKITANHRLLVNGAWKHAGEIRIGDTLLTKEGTVEKVFSVGSVLAWLYVYNIELENYHTYFADGIYVHNEEKGGGGAREDFRDVVIYETVRTDSSGNAEISFTLPDNLTSWRLTLQAVTEDLFGGEAVNFVPVGLPFFVDTAINTTYLENDELTIRLRTFGTANIQDNIDYTVESETLPFGKIELTGGNITSVPLGRLAAGNHQIKITARHGNYSDAMIRELNVLSSYFTRKGNEVYEVSPELTEIKGSSKGRTTLLLSSYERGRFYPILSNLSYTRGERLDQKMTKVLAKRYINNFFGGNNEIDDIDAGNYQVNGGGIALLPYSDDDLELTAKFINLIRGENLGLNVDEKGLREYLEDSLNDRESDISRIAIALYGLSAYREPVLITLQNMKDNKELELMDKIYIALALDNLGAKEEARSYYLSEIESSLEKGKKYTYVKSLSSEDDNIIATTLLAALTASLEENDADGLSRYALDNRPKETLKNFEILLYIKGILPALQEGDVAFSYETSAQSGSEKLSRGETFRLELTRDELAALQFDNVDGRIILVSVFEEESTPGMIERDPGISLQRNYFVGSELKEPPVFNEGDLVKVSFSTSVSNPKNGDVYQIIDYLPSGMRPVTGVQRVLYKSRNCISYPVSIENQKVTLIYRVGSVCDTSYYARVVSKGIYKAEPAIMQSVKNLESVNISNEGTVTIR